MLRRSILVLATAVAVGSGVLSTSAFAFGPPLPDGGPPGGGFSTQAALAGSTQAALAGPTLPAWVTVRLPVAPLGR
jgi:hypothetical protein